MRGVALIAAWPIALGLFLTAGCAEEGAVCIGKITKLYTQQRQPTTIIVGGGKDGGGGIGVPVGGGTDYYLYMTRADGSQCSRRVNKKTWLNKHEGDTYAWTGGKS